MLRDEDLFEEGELQLHQLLGDTAQEAQWEEVLVAHARPEAEASAPVPAGGADVVGQLQQDGRRENMFIHHRSMVAAAVRLQKQSWMRLAWKRRRAIRYLQPSPVGAFLIRQGDKKGEYILSVQAGVKVCHVLLCSEIYNGTVLFNVHPTPHFFEHLYDLVLFCSYQPFHFEALGSDLITLNLESAKTAERINTHVGTPPPLIAQIMHEQCDA